MIPPVVNEFFYEVEDGLGDVFRPDHRLAGTQATKTANGAVHWASGKPAEIGVSAEPGETVLNRMGANSPARVWVKPEAPAPGWWPVLPSCTPGVILP
jgi:hypothetical protein